MIEELFCLVDDFCQLYLPQWQTKLVTEGLKKRQRPCRLSVSELMTILIHFHQSNFRTFKHYYLCFVCKHLRHYFPEVLSYSRFVEIMPSVLVPLCCFLQTLKGDETGLYFIDSTTLSVCHHKRGNRNKTFKGLAKKSKSTMGWFFGFKLHIIINDKGQLMAFKVTHSTIDDRKPVEKLAHKLTGKLIGDKGYISQALFTKLYQEGLELITRIRKNMKNRVMTMTNKLLLRKRALIETVNDQLKNISQIDHTRHRSPINFMVNLMGGLIAYSLQPKKPSINLSKKGQLMLCA